MPPKIPTKLEPMSRQRPKAIVSQHQGAWVPFGHTMVCSEIWSAKKVPADAWRVLWWLTNGITKTVKLDDDPNIYGVVKGGSPIGYKDIGKDLHPSDPLGGWRSIQRSVAWLKSNNLIDVKRNGKGKEYNYSVIDSIRQFNIDGAPPVQNLPVPPTYDIENEDDFLDGEKPTTPYDIENEDDFLDSPNYDDDDIV